MTPTELVISKLEGVRQSGSEYMARCPAHSDREASLSIGEGKDGCALVHCHAGCTTEQVVAALGLRTSDLFQRRNGTAPNAKGGRGDSPSRNSFAHSNPRAGLTLAQYAEAKKLPIDRLQQFGLTNMVYMSAPAVRLPYHDRHGNEIAVQMRVALEKGENGDDRFRWRKGDKVCLYGLGRFDAAEKTGAIVLCEGASDAQTLWIHGIHAVGLPGADTWKEDRDAPLFDGFKTIYVVIEPDKGGETVLDSISKSRIRDRVRLVRLGERKDPSGLYLADPENFRANWQAACGASVPWSDQQEAESRQAAVAEYAKAKELLHTPDLFGRLDKAITARGYAGDTRPVRLGVAALTSRVLERPNNLAYVAPSGAGKNRAVDAAREFVPAEAVHFEGAGSAKALIYNDEDFQHRVVVVEEADSIPEDGPAASAIRSLAADNEMIYDVVERDEGTNRWQTRRITKPGPTGLITTSTKSLGEQLGTRLLEIPIPDDPGQTRAVLHAHARTVAGPKRNTVDLEPWLAVQRYLELEGNRQIEIPFASVLADLVPATAVRMRRDFRQLLTFIQAVAFLHQKQRQTSPDGWVVAVLDDYAIVRDLLAPVFDTVVGEGATPAVRQTVEAVQDGEEVSEAELARRLKISKSTVSWRVRKAIAGGWLVDQEKRERHPKRLARGVPLPDQVSALPTVEQVRERFECANRNREDVSPLPSDGDWGEE